MNPEAWSNALGSLRTEYALRCRERIAECEELLLALEADPASRDALSALLRHFHGMSGTGSSYGFPEVTEAAAEGERAAAEAVRAGGGETLRGRLALFRGLLARLSRAIDAPPAAAAPAEAVPAPAAPAAPASPAVPAGPSLLVVEDDPVALCFLRVAAAKDGFTVREATSVASSFAVLEGGLPQGAVVDVRLPDGSGYEVVEEIRRRPGGEDVAVVSVSASGAFLDKVEAIRSGADAFFEKPLVWSQIGSRLRGILERLRPRRGRVLSVEDDADHARFLSTVLGEAGYEVRCISDPARFDGELASFRPDLVLLDVLLPGPSGYDLARWLRRSEATAPLPVVFLTTASDTASRVAALDAGGDDLLAKPVPEALLLSTIAARIDRARSFQVLLDRDPRTGLLNRSAFLERAEGLVARYKRSPGQSSVCVTASLDGPEEIVQRFGYEVRDRIRVAFANLLRRRLRQADAVGCLDPDDFVLLLDDIDVESAVRLARRLLDEIGAAPLLPPEAEPFLPSFSAGVAPLSPWEDAATWLAASRAALGLARRDGPGRVRAGGDA